MEERSLRPCSLEEDLAEEYIAGYADWVVARMGVRIAESDERVVVQVEGRIVDSGEKAEGLEEVHSSDSFAKEAVRGEEHTAVVLAEDQTGEHNPLDLEVVLKAAHTLALCQEEVLEEEHTADFHVRNSSCYLA